MGAVSDFVRRVGSGLGRVMLAIGEYPIHCHRCHKGSTFGANEFHPVYDIPRYAHSFWWFCDDCKQALYMEYRFKCDRCGKRHNLANFRMCADCQAFQHPREAKRVESHNLRAWERGQEATLTLPEWLTTLDDWKWSCWCCGKRFEALDHFIPIAHGGGTTAENCFPICHRCNSMKGAFLPGELLQPGPRSPETHQRLEEYRRRRWSGDAAVSSPVNDNQRGSQGADETL